MVIANQGENFSVGANLMLVLLAAQEGEWDELNAGDPPLPAGEHGAEVRAQAGGGGAVRHDARRRLRDRAALPRACRRRPRLYMGLVEVGVGLIPAGGGCKEMLLRSSDPKQRVRTDRLRQSLHQRRGRARTRASCATHDGISMNPERLIGDAKDTGAVAGAGLRRPACPRTISRSRARTASR